MPEEKKSVYDRIMEVCLKRSIIYPDSEIHGSMAGLYDYGTVGARVKHNWENYWRNYFLKSLDEHFFEIETTNVTPQPVWEASGHLKEFTDPLIECSKCKFSEKADQVMEEQLGETFEGMTAKEFDEVIKKHNVKCPKCGGKLKDVAVFNMMYHFDVGAMNQVNQGYLRPETAQSSYVSFKREFKANRERLPLGLSIIGKAFRNEISPRNGLFRMREFTQAELQIFFDPNQLDEHPRFDEVKKYRVRVMLAKERDKGEQLITCEDMAKKGYSRFYVYYMARVQQFYESLGVPLEKLRFYEKNEEERAFYNKAHFDVEVWMDSFQKYTEVAGFHYRGDHDLSGHQRVSGTDMSVLKDGKRFIPHVLELSFGVDRNFFMLHELAYRSDEKRTYFALPRQVIPYTAGVYPLVNKEGLPEKAEEIYAVLKKSFDVIYDDGGSIGKRYARADEIGVMYGITVDFDTMKDGTVTVRERDSTKQERVKISQLAEYLYR